MKTLPAVLVRRGRVIRQARQRANMTQRELADLLGLQRPGVSAIEAGERDLTAIEAHAIAMHLQLPLPTVIYAHPA